ncbi:MAG TPA: hypothetical protein VMW89_06075 [Desulfatiglandales bacterium]|nr:hypothetical protein [Desulfatiglandales bacterium]
MTEYLLIGWEKIHEMLKDQEGNPAISLATLRQRYGPEMKRLGVVIEFNRGQGKRPTVCAWPSMVRSYFTRLQQEKWEREHLEKVKDI